MRSSTCTYIVRPCKHYFIPPKRTATLNKMCRKGWGANFWFGKKERKKKRLKVLGMVVTFVFSSDKTAGMEEVD